MNRAGSLALALVLAAAPASADPLRLRADALTSTASPAGLLVLDAEVAPNSGWSAEAVVWMVGARELDDTATGDVLVVVLRGRTKSGRANGQVGRFVSTLGALRATHVDGATGRVRLPHRFDLEAVAGVPVELGLATMRSWDWYVGGRASRRLGEWGSAGIAYGHRRDAGQLVGEELAADTGLVLGKRDDAGARIAYDVANPGIAEIGLTASHRTKQTRSELYASHRASSHLVPATSLFSVLGDVPSQRAGVVLTWYAAPRLDVITDTGARYVGELGVELAARARLRLDDRGTSMLGGELRRSGVGMDEWTGLRGTARVAVARKLVASTELELVIPDDSRGRGIAWPWGLAALGWQRGDWHAAVAIEASSTPEHRYRADVLATLSRQWSKK